MRLVLLSDVHANLQALDAVLDHAAGWGDAIACAGDLVGFGPDPEAVVRRLRDVGARCVHGNHEAMVLRRVPVRRCTFDGIRAVRWTRRALSPASRRFLEGLPAELRVDDVLLCHAHPARRFHAVDGDEDARDALRATIARGARRLVCGHTHRPVAWTPGTPWRRAAPGVAHRIGVGIVNPGSVGQSRDPLLMARYARLDTEADTVTFFDVPYDHEATRARLRAVGLRSDLCERPRSRLEAAAERWGARVLATLG